MADPRLKLAPLDPRWMGPFEHLLSGKEFGGCYCAVWTNRDEQWEDRCRNRPHENLEHTRSRVKRREHVGYLVSREMDGAIVGWTGSGPKTSFPLLKEKPGSRSGAWSEDVWSIGCLAVAFSCRGQGYSRMIASLVIAEARKAGAKSVEAYPLDPCAEGCEYRGSRGLYEGLGFSVADSEAAGEGKVLRMVLELAESKGAVREAPAAKAEEPSPSGGNPAAPEGNPAPSGGNPAASGG